MLAGDVYKPSMWHSIVKKSGFSHNPAPEQSPKPKTLYKSSREVLRASGLPRAGELGP